IEIPQAPKPQDDASFERSSPVTAPWRSAARLMSRRKDFFHFQAGYMLGGFGLMLVQPALPAFFMDVLHLSYQDLGLAVSACKGLGFVAASSIWPSLLRRFGVFAFCAWVSLLFSLFP